MKKLTAISLFIFWAVVVSVLTAGLVFYQNQKDGKQNVSQNNLLPRGASVTLNFEEIGKHKSTGDCWLIINNKVYNVTAYLFSHPGGADMIIPYCGKDGTSGFSTKGRLPAQIHSSMAMALLNDFYIGDLNQTVSSSNTSPAIPSGGFPRGESDD